MHVHLEKFSDKKTFTIVLIILIILLVFLSILPFPFAQKVDNINEENTEKSSYDKTNASLLPEGYNPNQVLGVAAVKESSIATVTPTNSTKSTVRITAIPPTNKENMDFTPTSTVEGRDNDRVLIFRLLIDRIEEYLFYYGKMPEIYVDKSSTPLTNEHSELIYFYNDTENRTNASSINLGSESYVFSRVDSCDNKQSSENFLAFTYSIESKNVVLCKENGSKYEYRF